jgi:hypothetical protein
MAAPKAAFATIEDWRLISGMRRSKTYDLLSKGHLRGKKLGKRTLIDVEHGLRFIRSQPDALSRSPPTADLHTTP